MASQNKLAAFGDRTRIIWSLQSNLIFRGNPNIARPGQEGDPRLEWIPHYKGNRLYAEFRAGRWHFRDFQCQPGEVYFDADELEFGSLWGRIRFAVIEPRVKPQSAGQGQNKQWPVERYQQVAELLASISVEPVQFVPPGSKPLLKAVRPIETPSFRYALAVLGNADLYIGPEGGLHHGAAAVGTPAVVLFGGFISPRTTGYPSHENIAKAEPCGSVAPCGHCREAMASITVDEVFDAARRRLG